MTTMMLRDEIAAASNQQNSGINKVITPVDSVVRMNASIVQVASADEWKEI